MFPFIRLPYLLLPSDITFSEIFSDFPFHIALIILVYDYHITFIILYLQVCLCFFDIDCELQGKKHKLLIFICPNPSTELDP